MTINQTIDGVPRAWLEEYESLADLTSGDAQMLRALLDAPAKLPMIDAHNERLIASLRNRVNELEAAKPQGEPVATEHYQNKINHLKQLLRNVRATLYFSPEDVLAIDAALREDGE